MNNIFDLSGKVVAITGAAGLLGRKHAEAIASCGGTPILLDLCQRAVDEIASQLRNRYGVPAHGIELDITKESQVEASCANILSKFEKIDVLINNAANNPKVDATSTVVNATRLENFPIEIWNQDIAVGLTGSFLCAKYFGSAMAKAGSGVIVNISSDLGVIAPDQRLYRCDGVQDDMQNVKPVTYSVVKTALIGLTRYLATYWKGVRCNALCPGGVYNGQGEEFVQRVSSLIPVGRMAHVDEYQGAILFLSSDASSYMNGAVLVVDGGRSCW
jgi:NAD(P)-dependent dehydrogenase (short-subunit alcohol dehydrogenase family)